MRKNASSQEKEIAKIKQDLYNKLVKLPYEEYQDTFEAVSNELLSNKHLGDYLKTYLREQLKTKKNGPNVIFQMFSLEEPLQLQELKVLIQF